MKWKLACVLLVLILCAACGRKGAPEGEAAATSGKEKEEAFPVREPQLPADASSTQVAEALFEALDAEDKPALRGLAARRTITEDVNRIGRGRIRMSEDKAVELAISGWQATYLFIEKGSTAVTEERIDGNRASALADCRNDADGRPRRLEVELARERSGWRVSRLVPR